MSKIEELRKTFDATTQGEWARQGAYVKGEQYTLLRECGNASVAEDQANTKFCALAHNLMPTLLDAVEMVRYAADVFEGACCCGKCGPCLTAVKMRALLKELST